MKGYFSLALASVLLLLPAVLHAADPVVSNFTAAQRMGTRLVDIAYDVAADTPMVSVALEVSVDGGSTWTVPVTASSGNIGPNITVGTGKSIVWDAGVDWNNQYSAQTRYRLTVDDGVPTGPPVFSFIPAGPFTMGRTSGDADTTAPPVTVNVSAFYMGKYEVTKAEWDEIRAWGASRGYTDLPLGVGKAANHPVIFINWPAMVKWSNARSQKEGLTPVYTEGGSVMKTGSAEPSADWSANGYRLPTEAEWEKAARGGVSGKRFPWGTDTITHNEANYRANSSGHSYDGYTTYTYHPTFNDGTEPYTSPVGSFAANGYGLYDMSGNVSEWCWDWHGSFTYANNASDPTGAPSGTARVLRGGGWDGYGGADHCRAAARDAANPGGSVFGGSGVIGFRLARSSVQ